MKRGGVYAGPRRILNSVGAVTVWPDYSRNGDGHIGFGVERSCKVAQGIFAADMHNSYGIQ